MPHVPELSLKSNSDHHISPSLPLTATLHNSLPLTMPSKALTITKKLQLARQDHDKAMIQAVQLYQQELLKKGPERPLGFRKVCTKMEEEYFRETKREVSLNHNTLRNLVNGGRTKAESNAEKSWVTDEETEEIIKFLLEVADWGYPLSQRRLKEQVDHILRAWLGTDFPEGGVSGKWPYRFIEKHSDRLHIYTAKPLDTARGQAVNEHANARYFDMVEDTQLRGNNGNPIPPECTYAMDEAGFVPFMEAGFECVIGAKGKKIQHKQRGGIRETITVLLTICADGTALSPVVIFKGSGYLVKWLTQDNPAGAS